jgi:hypothetical protein
LRTNRYEKNFSANIVIIRILQDYEFVFYRAGPPNLQVKHHRLTIRPVPSDAVFGEGFVSRREKVNLAPA